MTVAIAIAVATIEALVEVMTQAFPGLFRTTGAKMLAAMLVGVGVAMVMPGFDLFAAAGVEVWPPVVGRILTGLIASRGAQYVHDFLSIAGGLKDRLKGGAA